MHFLPSITENSLNLSSDPLSRFIRYDLIVLLKDIMNPWGYNPPTYMGISNVTISVFATLPTKMFDSFTGRHILGISSVDMLVMRNSVCK